MDRDHRPRTVTPDRGHRGPTPRHAGPRHAAVAVVLASALVAGCGPADEDATTTTAPTATEAAAIDGVQQYVDLAQDHVDGEVEYDQDPPVGGPHAPVWQSCGFYDTPVADENAVHSLEHGAVWLTYDPSLANEQVAELRARSAVSTHVLVSPRQGQASPVIATAWGLQLELDGADDDRLDPFLTTYTQGPQTPEPGVTCAQGLGEPLG